MADTIQFTFTAKQMPHFLAWRAQVEAETGAPLAGVVFSFLVTRQGDRQILVWPSTDQDFKLKNIARLDGTYDTFALHEEILAEYDEVYTYRRQPSHIEPFVNCGPAGRHRARSIELARRAYDLEQQLTTMQVYHVVCWIC
jgi:hypothetical protein